MRYVTGWNGGTGIWLCGVLLFFGAAQGGEKTELTGRPLYVKLLRDLKDPFLENRVKAIRELGNCADADLIREFKVLDALRNQALSDTAFEMERVEALRSLGKLSLNNFRLPTLLEDLTNLVTEEKKDKTRPPTPVSIQVAALNLIVNLAANEKEARNAEIAYLAIEKIWNESKKPMSRVPLSLRAQILEAASGFYSIKKGMPILLEGLEEKIPRIRNSAIAGLTNYLANSSEPADEKIKRSVINTFLAAAKEEKETGRESRILCLLCLDTIAANGGDFSRETALKTAATELLKTGTDEEVVAAIRFLLRTADEKVSVVDDLLAAARSMEKSRSFDVRYEISKALVEVLNRISRVDRTRIKEAQANAQKIVDYFLNDVLDPNKKQSEILRQSAVFGLGAMPIAFDRTKIVKHLILVLEAELLAPNPSKEMIERCETSLMALTGEQPFRIRMASTGEPPKEGAAPSEVPDIKRWKEWEAKYSKWLEPDKSPMQRMAKDYE